MARACVLVALLALAAAAPTPFKNCGTTADIMAVTSLDVSGTVAPGSTITIGCAARRRAA